MEVIEGWRKLQNDGHYILPVINILRLIKSIENSTVGMYSMRGRNVKIYIYIDGWNPWNVEKEESNERYGSTKSVGFLKYSRNTQCSKKGSVLWTAIHHIAQTAVFRRPVIPLPRFKTVLSPTAFIFFLLGLYFAAL